MIAMDSDEDYKSKKTAPTIVLPAVDQTKKLLNLFEDSDEDGGNTKKAKDITAIYMKPSTVTQPKQQTPTIVQQPTK